jgi:hypothetical protein
MKRKLTLLLLACGIPAVWAGPASRTGREVRPTGKQVGSLRIGGRAHTNAAGKAATPPPAPGVVQVHIEEGQVFAYFVATSAIPAGSTIGGAITIVQNGQSTGQLVFDDFQFGALNPGDFITLPQFSNLGDLFPTAEVYYTVDVTSGRTLTEANGEFLSNEALAFGDLANFAPVITGTSQRVASNRDMILVINGAFTGDTPLVVLENAVAPASGVTLVSPSEIDVDLSQVPNLDLTALTEYLLTVSQAGFGDTIVYRYAPQQPGTFNLAPQQ